MSDYLFSSSKSTSFCLPSHNSESTNDIFYIGILDENFCDYYSHGFSCWNYRFKSNYIHFIDQLLGSFSDDVNVHFVFKPQFKDRDRFFVNSSSILSRLISQNRIHVLFTSVENPKYCRNVVLPSILANLNISVGLKDGATRMF